MLISVKEGVPYFIFDQILLVKEIRDLFKVYEDGSIHYAILFGWDGSPFKSIDDEKIRHEAVMLEIKNGDWIMDCPKLDSSKKIYEKDVLKAAVAKINQLAPLLYLKNAAYYSSEIQNSRKMLEELNKLVTGSNKKASSSEVTKDQEFDPADIKKIVDSKTALYNQIKQLEKNYEEEMSKAKTHLESATDCTINHFLSL